MATSKAAKVGTFQDGRKDIGVVGLARLLQRNENIRIAALRESPKPKGGSHAK